jgi:serine/threonine protein kinase
MNDNDDEEYDDDEYYPADSTAEADESDSIPVVPTGSPMPAEGSGAGLPPLEEYFDLQKPSSLDTAQSKVIFTLLRQILDYDPARRPTTSDLLEHPRLAAPPSHDDPNM